MSQKLGRKEARAEAFSAIAEVFSASTEEISVVMHREDRRRRMNPELKREEAKAEAFSASPSTSTPTGSSGGHSATIVEPSNEKTESLRYVAFDLEIAKEIPEDTKDWNALRPLGISCAATLCSDGTLLLWHGPEQKDGVLADQMSVEQCRHLADYLVSMQSRGYPILTFNGLGFDFRTLCEECQFEQDQAEGMYHVSPEISKSAYESFRKELSEKHKQFMAGSFTLSDDIWYGSLQPNAGEAHLIDVALNHIDIMFAFFASKGFAIGLDVAAKGMGLPGKSEGMHGGLAPKLWKMGRLMQDAILAYCAQDVRTTADLYEAVMAKGKLTWRTRKGNISCWYPEEKHILPVCEALKLPEPDTSWMNNYWGREHFTGWLRQ